MNKRVKEVIAELEVHKSIIKNTINKDKNLTIKDFENFIKLKYGVNKIYNSINEHYMHICNKDIGDDYDQYVDDLALNIVKTTHKVFDVINAKIDNKNLNSTLVFYSYEDKFVVDIFIQATGIIEDADCMFLFRKNGTQRSIKAIKQFYGMSDKEAERLLKLLI